MFRWLALLSEFFTATLVFAATTFEFQKGLAMHGKSDAKIGFETNLNVNVYLNVNLNVNLQPRDS